VHVFIAGVMQGVRQDDQIDDQFYRMRIGQALQQHIPEVRITDPWALNPNSLNYDADQARHTFLTMTKEAGRADLLIAYLPVPSMGTAMEMWEAYQSQTYIIAVTPLIHHWAVRFTADEIVPDLDSLLREIENGRIPQLLTSRAKVDAPSLGD
jgi:hypothetical protein